MSSTPIPPKAIALGQKILAVTQAGVATGEFSHEDGAALLATALGFFCQAEPGLLVYAIEHAMKASGDEFTKPEEETEHE